MTTNNPPLASVRAREAAWLLRHNLEDGDKRMAVENCNALISLLETGEQPHDLSSARELASAIAARLQEADGAGALGVPLVRPVGAPVSDEAGWLVEEGTDEFTHWITMAENGWPKVKVRRSSRFGEIEEYQTPIGRTKDANEALRFARREDAEAFIRVFDRFLLQPRATEHMWPIDTDTAQLLDEIEGRVKGLKVKQAAPSRYAETHNAAIDEALTAIQEVRHGRS